MKYKQAIEELYNYRKLPSIRSEKDEKRDVKDTGTTLHYDVLSSTELIAIDDIDELKEMTINY